MHLIIITTGSGPQNLCVKRVYSRVLIRLELRPLHYQKPREDMDENPFDPRRHLVCLRGTKVNI